MWLNNVIYEERVIENERLELTARDALYFLGHNLTLRRCVLVLRVPAERLHINRAHLVECTVEAQRELKNFKWSQAHLSGCRFTGRLIGNDFGSWRDTDEGSIAECDFTSAYLDQTRFLGCDVGTLRFPSWPCFTLLDPVRRWRDLRALPWPGDIGPVVIEGYADRPPSTKAVTYSAPELAKRSGTTPEAIKVILEQLDGVSY
ncbi:hypothetical protein [Hyalangium gracile]|uniref:hypothetical protein n=1 Tax=Hyalangium gracile TaxID=394092 RepID=UPI001CCD101F|nr:hypothetical protein [Hyalangium gracile]